MVLDDGFADIVVHDSIKFMELVGGYKSYLLINVNNIWREIMGDTEGKYIAEPPMAVAVSKSEAEALTALRNKANDAVKVYLQGGNITRIDTTKQVVEKTVKDVWQDMGKQATSRLIELENEKFKIERDIQALIDRITQTRNQTVAAAYEGRLEELTRSRNLIGEDIAYTSSVDMSFNGALRTVFDFIEKPYQLWCTGNEEDKKTTLKLVFAKRARHDLNDGFRTAAYSLPFLIMQQSVDNKSGVVVRSGLTSNSLERLVEAMSALSKSFENSVGHGYAVMATI